jgi:hypothetical protein
MKGEMKNRKREINIMKRKTEREGERERDSE